MRFTTPSVRGEGTEKNSLASQPLRKVTQIFAKDPSLTIRKYAGIVELIVKLITIRRPKLISPSRVIHERVAVTLAFDNAGMTGYFFAAYGILIVPGQQGT